MAAAANVLRRATSALKAQSGGFHQHVRSLHRTVVAQSTDTKELDEKAKEFYNEHPRSHYNIAMDDIVFKVGSHFVTGEPHPQISLVSTVEPTGLLNVTPFAKTRYSWFGERGNLGKKSHFAKTFDGVISDPMDAQQEINLFPESLQGGSERDNQALLDYIDWMENIRKKYVEHLASNVREYPILFRKLGFLLERDDPETLHEMVSQLTHSPIKYQKDEYGQVKPDTSFVPFKQNLYFRDANRASKARIRCEMDTQMAEQGGVRRHVPLYDRFGTEIPLSEAKINPGDVISVENNITCQLYDIGGNVGAGLRRNLRSVVWLRSDETSEGREESPFKDYTF